MSALDYKKYIKLFWSWFFSETNLVLFLFLDEPDLNGEDVCWELAGLRNVTGLHIELFRKTSATYTNG